jgi:TPR repeat protein
MDAISTRGTSAIVRSVIMVLAVAIAFGQTDGQPKPLRNQLLDRALKGDAEAQFELGKNYETGRIGLPKDLAQAQHWYCEAASQGDPYAAASLGILFNFGKGVKRDYFQAYVWYERALTHLSTGNRDSVVEMRDNLAGKLTPEQIAEARRQVKEPSKSKCE